MVAKLNFFGEWSGPHASSNMQKYDTPPPNDLHGVTHCEAITQIPPSSYGHMQVHMPTIILQSAVDNIR